MATNIPPHNLGEIVDGLVALIKDENISDKKLFSKSLQNSKIQYLQSIPWLFQY